MAHPALWLSAPGGGWLCAVTAVSLYPSSTSGEKQTKVKKQ